MTSKSQGDAYVPPSKPSLAHLSNNYGKIDDNGNKLLESLSQPHIDAFNDVLDGGINLALCSLPPVQFELPDGTRISVSVMGGSIGTPRVPQANVGATDRRLFPAEARQGMRDYSGQLAVRFGCSVNGELRAVLERSLGDVPVMVRSKNCHLAGLTPSQLVARGEMETEFGGYFILRGREAVLRMQVTTRRNYPVCLARKSYKSYGKMFTEHAVQMRCVAEDHAMTMNVLHFLTNGNAKLIFRYQKQRFCVSPILIIRALLDITDRDIYRRLTEPDDSDYYTNCVASMLREAHEELAVPLASRLAVRRHLGCLYRLKMADRVPPWAPDEDACDAMLSDTVMIHLKSPEDKVNALCFMIRKLYSFVRRDCAQESPDNPMLWEVQQGSYLYQQVIKNKVQVYMGNFKNIMMKRYYKKPGDYEVTEAEVAQCFQLCHPIGQAVSTFVSTGNMPMLPNIICSDTAGLSATAEKISHTRYMSHFRAIHRGSFFATMRTTAVRQMLPEAWGFICPVHTPDGAPCGLLNHLTTTCRVTSGVGRPARADLTRLLARLGVSPPDQPPPGRRCYTVLLDGAVVGRLPRAAAPALVDRLRLLKCRGEVYRYLEVALTPERGRGGQYPALYLYTSDARMMRPVLNLRCRSVEYIGTLEQVYLNVAVRLAEVDNPETYTHAELDDTSLLSSLGLLVPLSDLNQSPRNMYQCQMSKQSMGTPRHNWPACSENKMYRLLTPHSPFFRPTHHDALGFDDFGQGTNAIVAVISYTGYDMEDAMIINKQSQERGFACGFIYKTRVISLKNEKRDSHVVSVFRRNDADVEDLSQYLDEDGIPHIGLVVEKNTPLACHYSLEENKFHVTRHIDDEPARVDSVKLMGDAGGSEILQRVMIVLCVERKPTVGDKFASRAGQKGICSRLYASEDLPWTESGLQPDIIFNPHGFPSRMTIAMMVECMAGKAAAVNGHCYDATPFRFTEDDTAIDYFGTVLERAGYNYYGTETMYSGVTGTQLEARIFFGVIHYQRLRHMVSDKWQVRSTGPVDALTRQPVKGRRKGGGVRFGEMERDGVMAHGTTLLVQDRMFNCSDKSEMHVCRACGSLLSPVTELVQRSRAARAGRRPLCTICGSQRDVVTVHLPYMVLHLAMQLAAMNVKLNVQVKRQ